MGSDAARPDGAISRSSDVGGALVRVRREPWFRERIWVRERSLVPEGATVGNPIWTQYPDPNC